MTKELLINLDNQAFDMTMPNEGDLKYGVDYDYIVESFNCEYKLNVKELNDIQTNYKNTDNNVYKAELVQQFKSLYPECTTDLIDRVSIPDTIIKKIYCVQSPKQDNGLPSIDYSLKARMLSDFRAKRSYVKKLMAQCEEANDKVGTIRYNAKQLAIKVICNSEYGASNNMVFAHYDSDIAAGVTYVSRSLIGFLTQNIESKELFVDEQFLKDNAKRIDMLKFINCLDVELLPSPYDNEFFARIRRHALRRIYNDSLNVVAKKIYKINIRPATVCYQDTDSNYYRHDYIMDYYTTNKYVNKIIRYSDEAILYEGDNSIRCNPEIIDEAMHMMLAHNELIADFAKHSIARRPYALGFEGAFIICRYLNRKKKYYGVKWGDDEELRLGIYLDDEAYLDNNIPRTLITDYNKYWKPKKTVIPQVNGEYIYLDFDKLLKQRTNYLDYIKSQNVKCTGVDLARRDQFKFINFFHCRTLQKDLRLMSYDGNNKWYIFPREAPMKEVIDELITDFQNTFNDITRIANAWVTEQYDVEFNPNTLQFSLLDFARNVQYKPGSKNDLAPVIKRLQVEGKQKYISNPGERMQFVVCLDAATKAARDSGKKSVGNSGDRGYTIDEVLDSLHEQYPESQYKLTKISYDDWINAKAISQLDYIYYITCLCKAMALYIIGDVFPNEMKAIDDGLLDSKKTGELISKCQGKIAATYLDKYFNTSASAKKDVRCNTRWLSTHEDIQGDLNMLIRQCVSGLDNMDITKDMLINYILPKINSEYEKQAKIVNDMYLIYTHIRTNTLTIFTGSDGQQIKIYNYYKLHQNEFMPHYKKAKYSRDVLYHIKEEILKII